MVSSIVVLLLTFCMHLLPVVNLLLISLWIHLWFLAVTPKYLNFSIFSEDFLATSKLYICPAFWWWDTTMYFVFPVFTSRPTSLLASNRVSLFFFMVFMILPNILMSLAYTRNWYIPFDSSTSSFSWTFLLTYSKVKLKHNYSKA